MITNRLVESEYSRTESSSWVKNDVTLVGIDRLALTALAPAEDRI